MRSQVGGKYDRADDSVFRVKRALIDSGVAVSHPWADAIRAFDGERAFAFDPAEQSFSDVERHYYDCIRSCDFHTVCNQFGDAIGYLGGSASLELAYAMCHKRPIVALHPIAVNATVDIAVRSFIAARQHLVLVHDFLHFSCDENAYFLSQITCASVNYGVEPHEHAVIDRLVRALFASILRK